MSDTPIEPTPQPETEFERAQRKLATAEAAVFAAPVKSDPFEGEIKLGTNT